MRTRGGALYPHDDLANQGDTTVTTLNNNNLIKLFTLAVYLRVYGILIKFRTWPKTIPQDTPFMSRKMSESFDKFMKLKCLKRGRFCLNQVRINITF